EARVGVRMVPTFPRSPLSFRTAGFPQYGWKAGFPSGAFLDDQRLKPAPGMRRPTSSLHPPFVRLVVSTVVPLCVGSPTRLRTAVEGHYSSAPGALAQVRVIVSRTVITYSAPSVPLAGTSRLHRMAAYTRCLRCAGAPKRPPSGSGLSLPIPSCHAALSAPGGVDPPFRPEHRRRHWPSPWTKGLGTPDVPAIRFARGTVFGATLVRNCYGLSGCWPPSTDLTGLPANGGFFFQAFSGSVALPAAGYDYNSVWTPLLAGLSPAGMAASLAALARAVRCKTEAPRPTNVRAATMYQASNVEHLLRAIMGIRAHPRLTSGKTSLGHHGTQSLGCAGQTVRPSLHSISQTSAGKLSILNYSVSVLMFDVSRIT